MDEREEDEELLMKKEEELDFLVEEFRLAEQERREWGKQVRQAECCTSLLIIG